MTLEAFREAVRDAFGPRMEHVTPESMRAFIAHMYARLASPGHGGSDAIEIPADGAADYDEIVLQFFNRALDGPADQAVILLWLFAGELYFSDLGERYAEHFRELMPDERP